MPVMLVLLEAEVCCEAVEIFVSKLVGPCVMSSVRALDAWCAVVVVLDERQFLYKCGVGPRVGLVVQDAACVAEVVSAYGGCDGSGFSLAVGGYQCSANQQ